MKLTKQLEKEIMQVYNAYWDSYLQGDVEALQLLLDDAYTQVGSAAGEVFSNKKDAVQFLYDTIDQVVGKLEMRNRKTILDQQDYCILIDEFCDLYALVNGNWMFYSKLRASTFLQQKKDGWKIIHQHSSFPDAKARDGENIAIDKIAAENLQLREAVKRFNIELKQKNRELEIEAALERVRARTMGMQVSEHLKDVIGVIGQQLHGLGLYFDFVNFVIGDTKEGFDTWNVSFGQSDPVRFFIPYLDNRLFHEMVRERAEKLEFNSFTMTENETHQFITHLITNTILKYLPEEQLQKRLQSMGMSVSTAVLNEVYLTMANYTAIPYTHEENSLLKRFGFAFQQAFTRFLDLQKAEAQAREAQIEAALERVRSKTMAMHNSNDVGETVATMFKEFIHLGIRTNRCGILIFGDENIAEVWTAKSTPEGNAKLIIGQLDLNAHQLLQSAYKSWSAKEIIHQYDLQNDDLRNYYEAINNSKFYPTQFDLNALPTREFHSDFYFTDGAVFSFTNEPVDEKFAKIIKRFAGVFGQTYRRYLDLQKAEAQAREAQIEAALEKVRSSSLAMHHSEELQDVVNTVIERLKALEISLDTSNILIFNKSERIFQVWTGSNSTGKQLNTAWQVSWVDLPWIKELFLAFESKDDVLTNCYPFEVKNKIFDYLFSNTDFKKLNPERKRFIYESPVFTPATAFVNHVGIQVISYSRESFSQDEIDIFNRFAKVFNQAYTRFLDLQKAEAQAREAIIETALEKVRSQSMAMHRSGDLHEVIKVLTDQLSGLGLKFDTTNFAKVDSEGSWDLWISTNPEPVHIPYLKHRMFTQLDEGLAKGLDFFADVYDYEEKNIFFNHIFENTSFLNTPEERKQFILNSKGFSRSVFPTKNIWLSVTKYDTIPFSDEDNAIFKRFAIVFEQAYTRFLDLQKAEAQAREAQIQLALERVRARGMAMYQSNELADLLDTVFKELTKLDIRLDRCIIMIYDPKTEASTWWLSNPEPGSVPVGLFVPHHQHKPYLDYLDAWKNRILKWEYLLEGADKKEWDSFVFKETELSRLPQFVIDGMKSFDRIFLNVSFNNFGSLTVSSAEPLDDASTDLLLRFAKVFDSTYTRFNDLQKAEAQAREAQIETALERVRSKTMAMHNSADVAKTVAVMFDELIHLGIEKKARCGIGILNDDEMKMEVWTAYSEKNKKVGLTIGILDMASHTMLQQVYHNWKKNEAHSSYTLIGEDETNYYEAINKMQDYPANFDIESLPRIQYQNAFYFKEGIIYIFSLEQLHNKIIDILKRFAKVFGQTYTRYLDLQKAEAQAREAQIEVALEKIRSRSLAMHHSDELKDVMGVMFKKLTELEILIGTVGILLFDEKTKNCDFWLQNQHQEPGIVKLPYDEKMMNGDNYMRDYWDAKTKGESFFNKIHTIAQKNRHFEYVFANNDIPQPVQEYLLQARYHTQTFIIEKNSALLVDSWDERIYSMEQIEVLKRVAKVFEQAYIRFLDLQKAESQAMEAIKRTSVDRVRAEIASMRTTNDLSRITPLIWNELTTLGVPFIRCGVFIMDDKTQEVQTYLSTPDGKAIASFHVPYHIPGQTTELVAHWQRKEVYTQHWDESAFIDYTNTIVQQGAINSGEKYLTENRPTDLYLHFLPFMQGMLYAGSETALKADELQLVQNLADAFASAYARYEDFNKLESAKEKIEKTLVDLKQAQSLIIQSEKMASLGELTAGIAHEIQNPLNFVNNFSELSNELIDEMNEELALGNVALAGEIAGDIKKNLDKINHHGKRAESIVRGMLQHSRSSSGQKELTDLNKLADEYLRLSYHGIRAKDKQFNCEIITDFDDSIGKINIIGQDMGRVILNLINNAFYAVNETKKQQTENYEATISVSTKKINDKVELRVKDNGNGIPQRIVDKIFQPFFTTKPTGDGAGLGLSLSYDIVKAHGGEIKVESNEGEDHPNHPVERRTEFIIQLPLV